MKMLDSKVHSNNGSSATTTSSRRLAGTRYAQLLMQFNEDIFKRNVLTDVECIVEGQSFKCHRSLLVCFSPYLKKKLLSSDGKPLANKVRIPAMSCNEFEVLLRYMYTGTLQLTCNTFFEIYKAASILEMHHVTQECLQVIEGRDDIRTYFYIFIMSKKLGAQENWMRAFRLITHRFEESVFSIEFMEINADYAVEILSAQNIGARSEVIVFLAGLNWLNHDFSNRSQHAVKIMECVRFSSMTMEEIIACYHPPFLPQVIQIPDIILLLFRATCYITAKAMGQETWFKQYASPKRILAFEDLPLELWHKKTWASTASEFASYAADLNGSDAPYEVIPKWPLTADASSVTGVTNNGQKTFDYSTSHTPQGNKREDILGSRGVTEMYKDTTPRKIPVFPEPAEREDAAQGVNVQGGLQKPVDHRIFPDKTTLSIRSPVSSPAELLENIATRENDFHPVSKATGEPNFTQTEYQASEGIKPKYIVEEPQGKETQFFQKAEAVRPKDYYRPQSEAMQQTFGYPGQVSTFQTPYYRSYRRPTIGQNGREKDIRLFPTEKDFPPTKTKQEHAKKFPAFPESYSRQVSHSQAIENALTPKMQQAPFHYTEEHSQDLLSERGSAQKGYFAHSKRVNDSTAEDQGTQTPNGFTADKYKNEFPEKDRNITRFHINEQIIQNGGREERLRPRKFSNLFPTAEFPSPYPETKLSPNSTNERQLHLRGFKRPETSPKRRRMSVQEVKSEREIIHSSSSVSIIPEEVSPKKRRGKKHPSILVIGGMNPKALLRMGIGGAVLNFDPNKNKWMRFSTLPEPRHNHAAIVYNNCLYVIGGCDPHDTVELNRHVARRTCYKLEFETMSWFTLTEMKYCRHDHSLAAYKGELYAIGGQDNSDRLLKSIEVFDIKHNKWTLLPTEMCCGRKAMGTTTFNGKIWIVGGLIRPEKDINLQAVAHVDCYDPRDQKWLLNVYCLPSPRCYSGLAVWNGMLYCVGGMIRHDKELGPTDEVYVFNNDSMMWEAGPRLPTPRVGSGAVVYGANLYVLGGFDPDAEGAVRYVNFLTPGAISWETAAPLPTHLFGLAAVSCEKSV